MELTQQRIGLGYVAAAVLIWAIMPRDTAASFRIPLYEAVAIYAALRRFRRR